MEGVEEGYEDGVIGDELSLRLEFFEEGDAYE